MIIIAKILDQDVSKNLVTFELKLGENEVNSSLFIEITDFDRKILTYLMENTKTIKGIVGNPESYRQQAVAAAAASAGTAVRSEPCRTELRAVVRSTLRQTAAACCMMRTGVKECARKLRSGAAPVICIMRGRSSRGSGAYTLT